eukprot:m.1035 g.1035  ORF g.1035 m.1035 type:complete len:211 (-) comp1661_c0_seq1:80-712(-)
MENIISSPKHLQALILGMDPVAKSKKGDGTVVPSAWGPKSSGLAFHFENFRTGYQVPAGQASLRGLSFFYNLNCYGDRPRILTEQGVAIVNCIRTIYTKSNSGTGNSFEECWYDYTLKLVKYFVELKADNAKYLVVFNTPVTNYVRGRPYPEPQIAQDIGRIRAESREKHPSRVSSWCAGSSCKFGMRCQPCKAKGLARQRMENIITLCS